MPETNPERPGRWVGFPGTQPPLIGRAPDLAALEPVLRDAQNRLISVTGAGGVGKTRLAIAAAQATQAVFPAGAVFVSLALVQDPALVISAVAHALGVPESVERPLLDGVAAALRDRKLLLLLDNFEHVLPASSLLLELLTRCPQLTVLVTSRTPVGLGIEHRFLVQPLALPPAVGEPEGASLLEYGAVALFVERTRWARPGFVLDQANGRVVADICRQLDGLPLAIELAAAWMRVVAPEDLRRLLDPGLPLLRGGVAERPDRQRTMRGAIAWSSELLTPDEARLFRALGIFVGGFTYDGAGAIWESVCPGMADGALLDLLASLVDKSLLQTTFERGQSRLRMLEPVREFALERLATHGEMPQVAAAHARHLAAFTESAEPHLVGPDEATWRNRCEAEIGNLRAALAWSLEHDLDTALRMAAPLWVYWTWYRVQEGQRWTLRILERVQAREDISVATLARAYTTHAALCSLVGDVSGAARVGKQAVALAMATGNPVLEGVARWTYACRMLVAREPALMGPELDVALPLMREGATTELQGKTAYAMSHRGVAAFAAGDIALGYASYEGAVTCARAAGSRSVSIILLGDFAGWCVELGALARAQALASEAIGLTPGEASWLIGSPLSCLALLAARYGDAYWAARLLGAVEAAFADTGLDLPMQYADRLGMIRELAGAQLGVAYERAWREGWQNPTAVIAEAVAQAGQPALFAP
ncbi:MAG: AAA family ATPase, partial [Thermomicrobiales bacterium]|nr:AAA family ATPase [Thermomicrobiales bacterium]